MHFLIVYSSRAGQTQKIAETIGEGIRQQGHEVTVYSATKIPRNLEISSFSGIILGAPIYMGRYPRAIRRFITRHKFTLATRPSGFFTVCMGIASQHPAERRAAIEYGNQLFATLGWQPAQRDTFAGAVKFTRYNAITRFIMQKIAKHNGFCIDIKQDHEFTDWEAVARFTQQFLVNPS